MNGGLREQGFRFVLRPMGDVNGFQCRWIWSGFVEPTDTDCTDMSDEEFAHAIVEARLA